MAQELVGKRVAIVVTDGFERVELASPLLFGFAVWRLYQSFAERLEQ
jgi:hypothetical protein